MNGFVREMRLDASGANSAARRVPCVISTTHPVQRAGYDEVLLHGSENVDLSRAPLPLIESHDGSRINIGLVENLRLASGKLRGELVLGSSARAVELWPDIEAGIVRSLSIAYLVLEQRVQGDTVEVTRWQPYETSLVSIPADPNAGTYRSMHMEKNTAQPADESGIRTTRSARRAAAADEGANARAIAAERELERVNDILAIGRHFARYGGEQIAHDAIAKGSSVDSLRELLLDKVSTKPLPDASIGGAWSGARDHHRGRQFSIVRAIAAQIDPRGVDAGYERECSQELARQLGRQPEGIFMPIGQPSERALTVAGAPALVGTSHLDGEFIDRLRERSWVMQLAPRVLAGLVGDVSIPRLNTSATSGWIAGDGADGLTPSEQGLDAVTLTPHTVGALTVLSRKMVLQGAPNAEQMVRDDFAKLIATELDWAALNGSGNSNEPRGVLNTVGITTGTYSTTWPSFSKVVEMEGELMQDDADLGSLAYLAHPALAAGLKSTEKASGTAQFVWTAGRERGQGEVNGLPAYATSNMPPDTIVLGNWADLLIGMWGAVDIAVDPYHDFAKGSIAVRVLASVDFGVRHPQSFVRYTRAGS